MRKTLLLCGLAFAVFASCKQTETEISTSDTTRSVDVIHDTVRIPAEPADTSKPSPDTDTLTTEKGARLLQVDEASKDASFLQFREQLIASVRAKNANGVMQALDSNIKLSFGGTSGFADFRKQWKPNDPNSPLWQKLGWVLTHGGSFRGSGKDRMFWAPYVYSTWPDSGPDAFEYGAIVGKIPVYEKADSTSRVVSTLDHHFVKVIDGNHMKEKQPAFVKIQTPSGKTGYVRSTQIRSQLDYRAGFDKRSGNWKMSIFIAGD